MRTALLKVPPHPKAQPRKTLLPRVERRDLTFGGFEGSGFTAGYGEPNWNTR